jgi:deazaflavin-dependent oxidoreductase (nitroreductase family)
VGTGPDWYANPIANPDRAAIELHGEQAVPVTPKTLEGTERERAWARIVETQPRYAKYQRKSDRVYPRWSGSPHDRGAAAGPCQCWA